MPKGIPNKKYTGEFKQEVIEDKIAKQYSVREVMRIYDITDHGIVERWERIYLAEGAEGLYVERRGIGSKTSGVSKGRPTIFSKKVEEDLLDEVQRLRAENDYLKKLNALVSKRVQLEKKHK